MRVLGISGSLRRDSFNTALLRAAAERLPDGVEFDVFERLAEIPAYDADLEDAAEVPEAVADLRERMRSADAVLVATPEYNASLPGGLKNALDWASRPFPDNVLRDKPMAVIGASTGLFGAVWAQAEVRKALKASGARVIENELPVGMADSAFADDGSLLDPDLTARLHDVVGDLVREVEAPVEQSA
jgi:chromate reductase